MGKLGILEQKYIVPPFSVLDSKQGYWQYRRRKWLSLGIKGELGRNVSGTNVSYGRGSCMSQAFLDEGKRTDRGGSFVSIFDPVLCEICYQWFCNSGGFVLDPFAGGSVRGIVASKLGFLYQGIDLLSEQVLSNEEQAKEILSNNLPSWVCGDARDVKKLFNNKFDFIFTCPPYFNLEIYSDNPADLSNSKDYDTFLREYASIVSDSVSLLKDNRFACFVISNIRDTKSGYYYNIVGDTIDVFHNANMHLYNDIVFLIPISSLPLRASYCFPKSHKLLKGHQNVLVFVKGDWRKASDNCAKDDYMENVFGDKHHKTGMLF